MHTHAPMKHNKTVFPLFPNIWHYFQIKNINFSFILNFLQYAPHSKKSTKKLLQNVNYSAKNKEALVFVLYTSYAFVRKSFVYLWEDLCRVGEMLQLLESNNINSHSHFSLNENNNDNFLVSLSGSFCIDAHCEMLAINRCK